MPLGFERLNERHKRPNDCINFIKPLEGPDMDLSQDFLERVAAICYPVMKANHITVMALEEHEPNMEFVGRNFNAGEVIQLCLKAPRSGHWLPFKHVQMVMMHELAHCKQMNHSKAFWQVRDSYAVHLRELWGKNYYGEGLWGKGQTLLSGRYITDQMPDAAGEVRSLCGGTYRGRGRKRKRAADGKPKLTYAERQQRRIARKFGAHGDGAALGGDIIVKSELEKGRWNSAKPKVAKSKRGRELRAAAALARFEQVKEAPPGDTIKVESDSETESDYEDGDGEGQLLNDKGQHVRDAAGHDLVRVCDDEDPADDNARREMNELRAIDGMPIKQEFEELSTDSEAEVVTASSSKTNSKTSHSSITSGNSTKNLSRLVSNPTSSNTKPKPTFSNSTTASISSRSSSKQGSAASLPAAKATAATKKSIVIEKNKPSPPATSYSATTSGICPVCSLANEPGTATCMACANVLDKRKIPGSWQCKSAECAASGYTNAGDCGVCGICGAAKV